MNSIQSNGYGFGTLFGPQGSGLGRILGNGHLSASIQGAKDTSSIFAADVVSRISSSKTEDVQTDASEQSAKDTAGLADSLQSTVAYVQERYGKHAATAVMGMVYNKIGDGDVTEESLGAGLLDSVKFIDRNFGMAEGDSFMSFLNDGLNGEMNTFFDNGLNERFFAASPGTLSMTQSFTTALAQVADSAGQDTADGILSILQQAMDDTENPMDAIKSALAEADTMLTDKQQTPLTSLLALNVAQGAVSSQQQVGTLLNVSV